MCVVRIWRGFVRGALVMFSHHRRTNVKQSLTFIAFVLRRMLKYARYVSGYLFQPLVGNVSIISDIRNLIYHLGLQPSPSVLFPHRRLQNHLTPSPPGGGRYLIGAQGNRKSTRWASSGLLENNASQRGVRILRSADVGMASCSLQCTYIAWEANRSNFAPTQPLVQVSR